MGFFSMKKPIQGGTKSKKIDLNKLIFELAEYGYDKSKVEQFESEFRTLRLFNKYIADTHRNVPSGTTMQTTTEDGLKIPVVTNNGKKYFVFYINSDDKRIQPQYFEMYWPGVLKMTEEEAGIEGICLWNNDKSYIAYSKTDFPKIRKLLGIT